jgi:hypothetical protein
MVAQASRLDLERHIQARTGRRIRDLSIELKHDQVVLRGHTTTYYLKQLAQHGVQELLPPAMKLENAIVVEPVERN